MAEESGKRRWKSAAVPLGITALLATALSGCGGQQQATHQAVCVQQGTNLRVADNLCDNDRDFGYGGGYGWYYVPVGQSYSRVGSAVDTRPGHGSFHPRGSSFTPVKGGAKASGGSLSRSTTVSKGGFGGGGGAGRSGGG
jgi:hypothetical protein